MKYEPRKLIQLIKETAGMAGPQLSIPVGKPVVAHLRPVATIRERFNRQDITLLTQWRNKYVKSFLNEFHATDERTACWLSDIVGPDDTKILFMLDDLNGRTFGYMGIAYINWDQKSGEADAIVRGEDAPKGTMKEALPTLLAWGRGHLDLKTFDVRVRSDNPACEFYRKLNFVELKRVPLTKFTRHDGLQWVEYPDATSSPVSLVYMTLEDRPES